MSNYLYVAILMGLVVAMAAQFKGVSSPFMWFIYGVLAWPVALVHVFVRRQTVLVEMPPKTLPEPLGGRPNGS